MEFCFVEAKNQLLGYGVVMWENEKVDRVFKVVGGRFSLPSLFSI